MMIQIRFDSKEFNAYAKCKYEFDDDVTVTDILEALRRALLFAGYANGSIVKVMRKLADEYDESSD